jgi:hypothetical protein
MSSNPPCPIQLTYQQWHDQNCLDVAATFSLVIPTIGRPRENVIEWRLPYLRIIAHTSSQASINQQLTDDFKEDVQAFSKKRQPGFQGK